MSIEVDAPIDEHEVRPSEGDNVRIHPIVSSSLAVGVATSLAVVGSATAEAAAASHEQPALKHPVASLIVSTTKPAVGTKVVVNASHSRLPKGDRLRKAVVKFGDGSKAITLHSLKTRAKHAYAKRGTFTVVLTVVDKHGLKSKQSRHVTVHAKPVSAPALPLAIPASVSPTSTISSLGLPVSTLTTVSALLGIPPATLAQLPVGFLGLLPAGDLTGTPLPSLPGLVGLPIAGDLVSLLTGTLSGLPFSLPTDGGLSGSQAIGTVSSTILSSIQLTSLSTLFGVPTSVLSGLPLKVLALLPGNLVQYVTPGGSPPATGLPLALPSGLSPAALISSLGLSSTALSSVSSLLGIPVDTLSGLPVGFLSLLPTSDLTGAALPSLPGLAGLPLVGNLVGMLLAGLPITIPQGIAPTTLISALPTGVLSSLQLSTLSTYFGIATPVLTSLPVNVLTLLPTGLLTGL